jgi:hypothetical protein
MTPTPVITKSRLTKLVGLEKESSSGVSDLRQMSNDSDYLRSYLGSVNAVPAKPVSRAMLPGTPVRAPVDGPRPTAKKL